VNETSLLIRAFGEDDAAAAASLSNWFIEHSAVHFGDSAEAVSVWLQRLRESGDRYPWVVAECGGRFAGFATSGRWRDRAAYEHTVEVSVYVEHWARGRGVGRALYEALFERLRGLGYHTAIAGMTEPNEASEALHRSMGFRRVGSFRAVGRKFDVWHDVVFFQLMLRAEPGSDGAASYRT
jgi:L-amino acid N-acyltransferase YncA